MKFNDFVHELVWVLKQVVGLAPMTPVPVRVRVANRFDSATR